MNKAQISEAERIVRPLSTIAQQLASYMCTETYLLMGRITLPRSRRVRVFLAPIRITFSLFVVIFLTLDAAPTQRYARRERGIFPPDLTLTPSVELIVACKMFVYEN